MAIRTVITRGYGNGTFNGTIPLVTLRGYDVAPEAEADPISTDLAVSFPSLAVRGRGELTVSFPSLKARKIGNR